MPLTPLVIAVTAFAAEPEAPQIPYEKYELSNGLDVILAPDHSTPIVHVNVWYHVGSADEEAGLTGFAHLFEHLMFQGSLSNPGEYFDQLEKIGANLNGTTSFDRTNFYETVPAEYLPLALFLESDRMGWLLDVLDQSKLDNQREVVKNERRQRYENPPYGEAFMTLLAAVFPEGHPYHHVPIGSHEDLERADLDVVKAFFRKWYGPDNASLVVTGDFEPKEAKKLIAQYYGGIPSGPKVERQETPAVTIDTTRVITQYDDVPERKVWLAWLSPELRGPGDADLDLLSQVLSDGKDSRLYYKLVKELRIAKDVGAYQQSLARGSMYVIQATAAEGHTTQEVVAAIDAELAHVFGDQPPTGPEIEAAKAGYEGAFYDNLSTIAGKADTLNGYNIMTGDPGWMSQDIARYTAATPASVLSAGQTYLTKPRVELHIAPLADDPAKPAAPSPTPTVAPEGK